MSTLESATKESIGAVAVDEASFVSYKSSTYPMKNRFPQQMATFVALLVVIVTCSPSEPDEPVACVPGESQECVGPGACKGGQVCTPDGTGFGPCDCGGGGGSGASSSSVTADTVTGTTTSTSGSAGGGGLMSAVSSSSAASGGAGTGGASSCSIYVGSVTNNVDPKASGPGIGGVFMYKGYLGFIAANAMCDEFVAAGSKACTYERIELARQQGAFTSVTLPNDGTAWLDRKTTAVMVNGKKSEPGPGCRCGEHASVNGVDGEYVHIASGNVTYFFDQDCSTAGTTEFDGSACDQATQRALLCCDPNCMP